MDIMTDLTPENSEVLTMAFVNLQPFSDVYTPESALMAGTLFPDIDKPFRMGGRPR